eukprot:1361963-Rhodomonas_salina.1
MAHGVQYWATRMVHDLSSGATRMSGTGLRVCDTTFTTGQRVWHDLVLVPDEGHHVHWSTRVSRADLHPAGEPPPPELAATEGRWRGRGHRVIAAEGLARAGSRGARPESRVKKTESGVVALNSRAKARASHVTPTASRLAPPEPRAGPAKPVRDIFVRGGAGVGVLLYERCGIFLYGAEGGTGFGNGT